MMKEIVTGSPVLIALLVIPSEEDTLGGTAERNTMYCVCICVCDCSCVQFKFAVVSEEGRLSYC